MTTVQRRHNVVSQLTRYMPVTELHSSVTQEHLSYAAFCSACHTDPYITSVLRSAQLAIPVGATGVLSAGSYVRFDMAYILHAKQYYGGLLTLYSTGVIQFNIQQFYVLPTQCIYVFCVDLRTNSHYFPTQY